jgi:hypothetical protein
MNLQIKGAPVPNNVIEARVPSPPMLLTYTLVRLYSEKEGDELLDTWEFLPLVGNKGPCKVKMGDLQGLVLRLEVFNPSKEDYVLKVIILKEDVKTGKTWYENTAVYEGKLSRKRFDITFKPEKHVRSRAKFQILSEDGELCFESFEAFFEFTP